MRIPRPVRRRLAAAALAAALALAPASAACAATPTSTTTAPGGDRAAAVQAVLDRVLGPGSALVTISDTIRTSTASTTSVQYGTGATGASASSTTTVAGTTTRALAQRNLVGATSTTSVTPPGSLVRQSVSVAVDRARIGARTPAALRRLVAATAGITRSRGDTLSLVVTPLAKPAAIVPASPSVVSLLTPYAVPALWVLGGLLAVAVLALALGGGPKRADGLVRRAP